MLELVKEFKADIPCFGHGHKSYHRVVNSDENNSDHFHHLISTGSVGKPKDGDAHACYVLLTIDQTAGIKIQDAVQVEFVRVEYDVEKAAQAVELSLLPDAFGDNLRKHINLYRNERFDDFVFSLPYHCGHLLSFFGLGEAA